MPVYNAQDYIARTLESLTQQSFKQIEIVCVDDCGSDNSASILREFAAKDARVRVVKNPQNLGLFETRRQGAAAAKGEYLLFCDADDYFDKDVCQKCFEILSHAGAFDANGKGKVDFIKFSILVEQPNGEFEPFSQTLQSGVLSVGEFEACYFEGEGFWSLCDKCLNKQTYLEAIELLSVKQRVTMSEDMLAFAAVLSVSQRCALLSGVNYYYCFNPNSVTRAPFDKQRLESKVSDLRFVLWRVEQLACAHYATHKNKQHKLFLQALVLHLQHHIAFFQAKLMPVSTAYQQLYETYHARLARGFNRHLARWILSWQKLALKGKLKEELELEKKAQERLQAFIEKNKAAFEQ